MAYFVTYFVMAMDSTEQNAKSINRLALHKKHKMAKLFQNLITYAEMCQDMQIIT